MNPRVEDIHLRDIVNLVLCVPLAMMIVELMALISRLVSRHKCRVGGQSPPPKNYFQKWAILSRQLFCSMAQCAAMNKNKETNLQAAAPELLEALEELLIRMRISGPYASLEKARKAIAKAKGPAMIESASP
jgi:hypothetical protein